jgi:multicomponent Na+:H+ antiporter subunit E
MRPIALFVTLFAFYVALSGMIHDGYLMSLGVGSALAVTLLSMHLELVDDEGMPVRYWGRTARYLPWLLWQIVLANWDVFKRVWGPKLDISPCVVRVPHRIAEGYGIGTFANSITLTPGTVTIEADEHEVLVHGLTEGACADVAAGGMRDRVAWVVGAKPGPSVEETARGTR